MRKYIGGGDSEASAEGTDGEGGAAGAAAAEVGAGAGEGDADKSGRHLFRAGRSDARVLHNSKRKLLNLVERILMDHPKVEWKPTQCRIV